MMDGFIYYGEHLALHEERQFISTIVSLLSDVEQTFDDLGRQAAKARLLPVNVRFYST
jgi:hypothetical protein